MDDRRAALVLALLALSGAGVRYALAPAPGAAPGDVRLVAADTPPRAGESLRAVARAAARLTRPLLPGVRSASSRGGGNTARLAAWRGSTACRAWARASSRRCTLT